MGATPIIRRGVVVACLILVLIATVILAVALWSILSTRTRVRSVHSIYLVVQEGTEKQKVLDMLGPPTEERTGSPRQIYWEDNVLPPEQAQSVTMSLEYRIETFFLPISFEFYFDTDGRLLGKHRMD